MNATALRPRDDPPLPEGGPGDGVLVVSAGRFIRARNAAAMRMLRNADALEEAAGRLVAVRPADDARLQAAFEAVLQAAPAVHLAPMALPLARRSGRSDYVLLLSRCRDSADGDRREPHAADRARVLVLVHDFDAVPEASVVMLQQAFALTPAEARIAARLADRDTPQHAAQGSGVSMNTVRTHLRAIYRKTGTTGQVELARRVAALSSSFAAAAALAQGPAGPAALQLVHPDETENFTGDDAAGGIASHPSAPIALMRKGNNGQTC